MEHQIKYRRTNEKKIKKFIEFPDKSFLLKRKSKFREVLFTQIPYSFEQPDILRRVLSKRWHISPPEAIISITGVCHQFNLKEKQNLKKNVINAVIKTGSWIVTCGTESGVVQFIEDAVNDYIALHDLHIPIVGIMSQRVLDKMSDSKKKDKLTIKDFKKNKENGNDEELQIPLIPTTETLDPNHTQFVFLDASKEGSSETNAASECREAFVKFLSNICIVNSKPEIQTNSILPVVLILMEGEIDALRTVKNMLENNCPVVVIDGSGGAANFLASCYRHDSWKNIDKTMEEFFEDNSGVFKNEIIMLLECCQKNKEMIYIFSPRDNTATVDKFIQDAMFSIYTDDYIKKRSDKDLKIISIKKQLKLVEKWERCDLAEKYIFIAKNRIELSALQTVDEKWRTKWLEIMQNILDKLPKDKNPQKSDLQDNIKDRKDGFSYFSARRSEFKKVKAGYFTHLLQSIEGLEKRINDNKLKQQLKQSKTELSNESMQDSVSELLKSSLLAKNPNFVKLVLDRIENFKAFVLWYMPKIYEECSEETVFQLVVQKSEKHESTEGQSQQKSKMILTTIRDFLRNLFGDTNFKFLEEDQTPVFYEDEKPFHHFFVWAILTNRREIAEIFWEKDTDFICSALFASAVLNELAKRAHFSDDVELSWSLTENAGYFETLACSLMTDLYETHPEKALKLLVKKVNRYNCTPISIAASQTLMKFMANSACQAKLNGIWKGDIALHTPSWRIGMTVLFPVLIIQKCGFVTIQNHNSRRINPSQNVDLTDDQTKADSKPWSNKIRETLLCVYLFYNAPVVKFFFYMLTYLAFVVIFSIFVLTDLHPLSQSSPSVFEYMTWLWTLSLAIEEFRQILQTDKGSFTRNIKFWAKSVWNIFDMLMFLLFFVSVLLRCLLNSDRFYYARLVYAITLAMFIFRTMHFFFVTRYLGPKVVMIGRMIGDLAFFFALFALFVFSFGIMYQAVLFPNSILPPWELFKDLIYLPYWQLYGELNLDRIEGKEPSECTSNPVLYTNGTMPRCPQTNQFNSPILAAYLILTNVVLVNLLIAMFSYTFQRVQDNSETIWKFNRYALVYEYYDRPMFPIPIVLHFSRILVLCYYKITDRPYDSEFAPTFKEDERQKLHIVESFSLVRAYNRQDTNNMMTDGRDMTRLQSTNTKLYIDDVYEEIEKRKHS